MVLSPLEKAIVYTLAYSAQFEFPLTKKEIEERLLFRLSDAQVLLATPEKPSLDEALGHLNELGVVEQANNFYFLKGYSGTVATRQKRAAYSEVKDQEIEDFLDSVRSCGWIKAVFVTGSAAVKNAEVDADLDFMIVTQPSRLWLTRLWVIWQAWRRGKRRSWQGEEKRSWCFNLWLESDKLALFSEYQSVYTAYELIQALPVLDRDDTAKHLLTDNVWAATYVPLAPVWRSVQSLGSSFHTPIFLMSVWSLLNAAAYILQRGYMNRHMTRERVERGVALFHPRDTHQWVLQNWRHVLATVQISLTH